MHYPTHLRAAFLDWLDEIGPEATVEVDYTPVVVDWRVLTCSPAVLTG